MTRSILSLSLSLSLLTSLSLLGSTAEARVADLPAPSSPQRIGGEKRVMPDAVTISAILRADLERVVGVFDVCVDSKGDVAEVRVSHSTRFRAYDDKIQRQIRTWKYQPMTLGGRPAPTCTKVTYIYQQAR
jgi:TonB family protein